MLMTVWNKVEIDRVCREKGVKFFAGDLFGMLGVLFADLQSHSYVEERKQPSAKNKDETETTVVPKQETYVSLEQALAKTFTGLSDRKLKNLDKNLFVLQGTPCLRLCLYLCSSHTRTLELLARTRLPSRSDR